MTFLEPTNPVVTVSGADPIVSTGGSTPVISIEEATTDQKGAVQLEDSYTSTSVIKAATSKSVKDVYDHITTVSGVLKTNIDGKSDIGHIHTESNITDLDKYTQDEVNTLITTISGKLDDHNELNNLDYSSSGHTGFQPEGSYLTDSDFSTYSGTLQLQIDDKSDLGHLHDDRYYTESEVDTISGSLQTNIDGKVDTSHIHDDRYYTESEIDDLITTISGKLDDHNELNNLDYSSSGHTGFQPTGDYLTESEFSTYSGVLQSQIDDKSDTGHLHDDRYYTESEVDTISGTLQTDIDVKDNYLSWTFAVDGITKDGITSGGVLNFVGGENITITRSAEDELTISGSSGGVIDHGSLTGLEDDDHTQYLLRDDFATSSGILQIQIDNKAELTHLHDDRYYTESEVDTISGSLQTNIDNKACTFIDLTDTPTTYSGHAGDYLKVASDELGVDYISVSDTVATTTVSGWDVYSAGLYYSDFEHNFGTEDIFVFIVDTTTNKEIGVEDIEIINNNTVRIYVVDDTYSLKINVTTGGVGAGGGSITTVSIWLGAESAYLPATNSAALMEVLGTTTYAGWSYLAFDDTVAEHAMWRVPMPGYDGGSITITAFSKPATTPGGAVTLQYDILTVGLANSEMFNSAFLEDTTVNISHSLNTTELDTDICVVSTTISPDNVVADDLMVIELARDVTSDDLSGDGHLVGILITYVRT